MLRIGARDLDSSHPTHSGGLAQLGERLHGMQEVSGSSPLSSTGSQKVDSSDDPLCSTRRPISMGLFFCANTSENHRFHREFRENQMEGTGHETFLVADSAIA